MKRLLLSVVLILTGCGRAYYRGQPVELSPIHEEICGVPRPNEYFTPIEQGAPQERNDSPTAKNSISPPPAISRQDGLPQTKCTTLIRINGKEYQVDSDEIVWRWP